MFDDFDERLIKGKKIIDDYFEENWGSDYHLNYGKSIFDIWAVSEAKRYECINTQSSWYKNMSKNEKQDALKFNDLLEEEFEDYAEEVMKKYQKKYPILESKKSMKESINGDCYIYFDDDRDNKRYVLCDYVKGITDTSNWFVLNKYIIDAIHIFKNEKQAQKFIDEHLKYFADQDKVVIAEYPQTVSGFFESKKSARKSINEENESVIINGKKTNFKINNYGTFFGEKIKYMLIGKPSENEDVLIDFLEENSNFEFKEYKIPYSIVYYIYNDEKSLFGVAYRHYIRLTNNEKDAQILLAYATDKRDLYNGL